MKVWQKAWARERGGRTGNSCLIVEFRLEVKKNHKLSLCLLEGAHSMSVHFCWLSNGKIKVGHFFLESMFVR